MTYEELTDKLDDILAEVEDSYVPVTHIMSGKAGYCLVNPKNKDDVLFVPEHPSDVFDPAAEVSWCEVTPRLSTSRKDDFMEFVVRAITPVGKPGNISIPIRYFKPGVVSEITKVGRVLKELEKQGGQQ